MAYAKAGQYGPEAILDPVTGDLLPGREVQVDAVGTSTPASLYTDADRTAPADNPVSIDSRGNLSFFAEPGRYDIKLITLGAPGSPLTVVVNPDPAEADADVAALQAQVSTLSTTVAGLGIGGMQTDIADLQTDVAALQSSLAAHLATVVTHTVEEVHTWAVLGDGGTSTVFVPFAINEAPGETVKVSRCVYRVSSGSPTLKLQKNGADLTGFEAMIASAVQGTTDPPDQDVVDKDELGLVCTANSWSGWIYVSVLLTRSKTI